MYIYIIYIYIYTYYIYIYRYTECSVQIGRPQDCVCHGECDCSDIPAFLHTPMSTAVRDSKCGHVKNGVPPNTHGVCYLRILENTVDRPSWICSPLMGDRQRFVVSTHSEDDHPKDQVGLKIKNYTIRFTTTISLVKTIDIHWSFHRYKSASIHQKSSPKNTDHVSNQWVLSKHIDFKWVKYILFVRSYQQKRQQNTKKKHPPRLLLRPSCQPILRRRCGASRKSSQSMPHWMNRGGGVHLAPVFGGNLKR